SQEPVEFLDLAAFALPAHPRVFPGVPAPCAMKQKKAIRVLGTESLVEMLDALARRGKNRRIAGELARIGVGEVTENREMNARIQVTQREDLDMLEQRGH